ncbi:MAG: hypothetical protein K2X69_07255 [Silvanigrellaceae bacterium]|nr:hypothetical protein [Silvanigrellaceae bacterium]
MKNKSTLPCLFIAHGSPLNAILKNDYTEKHQSIGEQKIFIFVSIRP